MLRGAFAALLLGAYVVSAAIPTPKEHFGFDPGDDYKLANYAEITAYFEKLAGVKSPGKFVELTTEYAKSAQETFVAEATKIGELYKAFAKEAFTPFTSSFLPK